MYVARSQTRDLFWGSIDGEGAQGGLLGTSELSVALNGGCWLDTYVNLR